MSATAVVMVALLVHLGSAGLDSSSTAMISRFEETVRTASWDVTVSTHRDAYRLDGREQILTVQRMRDADLVYAVASTRDPNLSQDTDTVGIVSFPTVRQRVGTTSRTGAGVIPLASILYASEQRVAEPAEDMISEQGSLETSPNGEPFLHGEVPPDDPAGSRDLVVHYRWSPGEISVAMPGRRELFILQYR